MDGKTLLQNIAIFIGFELEISDKAKRNPNHFTYMFNGIDQIFF